MSLSVQEKDSSATQLSVVAGVIKEGDTNHMTKLLFRLSRGRIASFYQNVGTGFSQQDGNSNLASFGKAQNVSYSAFVLVF